MRLAELEYGHCFKYFAQTLKGQIAFKSTVNLDSLTSIIPINNYLVMNPGLKVKSIARCDLYIPSLNSESEAIELRDVEPGMIVTFSNQYEIPKRFIVTKHLLKNAIIVGDLGSPDIADPDSSVSDLGPAGDYLGYRDSIFKNCPNCNDKALSKSEAVPNEGAVNFECLNCGVYVEISYY